MSSHKLPALTLARLLRRVHSRYLRHFLDAKDTKRLPHTLEVVSLLSPFREGHLDTASYSPFSMNLDHGPDLRASNPADPTSCFHPLITAG